MSARITRRFVIVGGLAALAGACVEGKLVLTIAFEVTREASAALNAPMHAFALRNTFKVHEGADTWPSWTLNGEDLDIRFGSHQPETANVAPDSASRRYTAQFYDHSVAGSQQLQAVASAFARAVSSVEGVRKLGNDGGP